MKAALFCFFVVVMVTCLVSFEHLSNEEKCNWICDTKSEDLTSEDLDERRLIKLELEYTERVNKTCENETLQAYENTSTTIWLKKMSNTSSGALDLFNQIAYEEIFSGRIFGGYKYIHVSCILKLTTRNHSLRLSINSPQSVVYFVEEFANRSNTCEKFLILMRRKEGIQVTFDVSSGISSVGSAKNRELIVTEQLWKGLWRFCYVLIVIAIALWCPQIVVACGPSEIVGNLKDNHYLSHPVRESETTAQEHPDITLPNHQSGRGEQNNLYPIPQFASGIMSGDLSDTCTDEGNAVAFPMQAERYDSRRAELVATSANISRRSPESSVSSGSWTLEIYNSISDGSRCDKSVVIEREPIQIEFVDMLAAPADTHRQLPASRGARGSSIDTRNRNGRNTGVESPSVHIEVPGLSESVPERSQRVTSESTADEVRMILDGKDPVALGSWIGNWLFINSAKGRDNNKYLDMLKDIARYILCFIFPTLLIFGLGDLSVLMMKYNSLRPADFPNNSFMASFFTKCRIGGGVTFLSLHLLRSHYTRKFASKGVNAWRSCFVHCNHVPIILRLKCFFTPCDQCKNSPPDCPTQVDIPNNIEHNVEKITESILKHYNCFAQCVIDFCMTTEFSAFVKVFSVILLLAPAIFVVIAVLLFINFLMDLLLSSPIVCSLQPRIWLLKESLQGRFRGRRLDVVWDIVEAMYKLFLFAWLVYCSICDAIGIVNACIAFFLLLRNNLTDDLLKHVFVVLLIYIYCFSCYSSFKSFYSKLVEKLCENYKTQYEAIKKTKPNTNLVNYEQGDHTAIEYKLFEFVIHYKEINKPIRNRVGVLLLKIVGMFVVLVVLFPFTPTLSPLIQAVFFTLSSVFFWFNNCINDTTFNVPDEKLKSIVQDFIKKKKL